MNSIHTWQINVLRASLKKTPHLFTLNRVLFIYQLNRHFTCRQHHHIGKPAGSVVFHLLFLLCSLKHIVISRERTAFSRIPTIAASASPVRVICAPAMVNVSPSEMPRPQTRITAVITRLRERVRSTLFSTTLRTPQQRSFHKE